MNNKETTPDEKLARLLSTEGVYHAAVLEAIAKTKRADFVPAAMQAYAHEDMALPIGDDQTISQPYVVARMTALLLGERTHLTRVLEIGTGSGYQAAVLSHLCDEVYTIERIQSLYESSKMRLQELRLSSVHVLYGDGYLGWEEHAPYQGIIVTAGATSVPQALLDQLDPNGGRLVIPVLAPLGWQVLQLIVRQGKEYKITEYDAVAFVPLLHGVKAL